MGTAVDVALGLDAVADHAAFAVGASGRHGVDRALEAVERHRPVALGDAERLVIVVTANITLSHGTLLSKPGDSGTTACNWLGSTLRGHPSPDASSTISDVRPPVVPALVRGGLGSAPWQ